MRTVFLLWLALAASAATPQGRGSGTLVAVQGPAQVQRSGAAASVPGHRNMPLGAGDQVRTGPAAQAQVLFADGSTVTVNQNSSLRIGGVAPEPERLPRLDLLAGELFARISPGRRLSIETPAAVAGVRGTELNLAVAEDGTSTLTVAAGEVSFSNAQGSVMVREAQQSVARTGQAPTAPVTVNVPFIIEWTHDVLPAVLLLETRFAGDDPEALERAEEEAARLPAGPARSLARGDVRHDRGEIQAALAGYNEAAAVLPTDAPPAERARIAGRQGQALLELGHVPEAIAAFRTATAADPAAVQPRLGLVMALLSRRELEAALQEAEAAVGAAPDSARSHLALALVRIRRGERSAAGGHLERALALDPDLGQAHAWKAYLLRADGRLAEAETAARRAVALAPRSAVAQQSLAEVLFLQGRPREARPVARRAAALNPLSAAAQVALGQTELALGEIDAAARAAHRAVALDPDLERSRYFLGLTLAEQRDLEGAERQLRRALALDPELLEARTLLARVLTDQGQRAEALAVAREAVGQAPQSAAAHSAVGSILWRQGRLDEAAESFRRALALSPGSVQAHLELARVYLDQNNMPDALTHALEAVDRAISSSEAHGVLGLVYERSGNSEQAVRQYREAISLSPDNALARIGLALQSPNPTDSFVEIHQALLRDPSVPQQQFKPGVTAELSAAVGTDDFLREGFRHRDQYAGGKIHDFGFGFNQRDGGWRGNDEAIERLLFFNLAARPTPRWNSVYSLTHASDRIGLSGLDFQPDADARARSSLMWHSLAGRYQAAPGTHVWLRAAYESFRQGDENPDAPTDGQLRLQGDNYSARVGFELRLDQRLGRFDTLTYGVSTSNNPLRFVARSWDEPSQSIHRRTFRIRLKDDVHYGQLDHRRGRLALTAGAQHVRTIERTVVHHELAGREFDLRLDSPGDSRWLPYAAGTFQVAARTLVRLIGHERTTQLGAAALLPTEAYVTSELVRADVLGRVRTFEFDLEHRFSPALFTKLFLFRSQVRNLRIEEPEVVAFPSTGFVVPQARVEGIGLRLERQLTPFLAGYFRWTASRATDRGQGPTHGWQLPQSPRTSLLLGLNFVDRAGTKAFLEATYRTGMFAESLWWNSLTSNSEGFDPLAPRPREPANLLFNLRLGRERSVRQEWIVRVDNLFNRAYSLWSGLPGRGRTLSLELRQRF